MHDAPADRRFARSSAQPAALDALLEALQKLPGVGRRSAERLAFHILKAPLEEARSLARAIEAVKREVRHCAVCWRLTERSPCSYCEDARRDRSVVLVVEQPSDVLAIEATGAHRGVYHVLMGRVSPLEGVGPGDLTIEALIGRVRDPRRNSGGVPVREVVLALSPTLEGDGTALHILERLKGLDVQVTRLARGLPSGAPLELVSKSALADAIAERRQASASSDRGRGL
ncbi:MAG: recombination protein RecR [Planctomycetota bacterium]|nr:MAG: recombination protein RecR [Planctomycetota bacterium]